MMPFWMNLLGYKFLKSYMENAIVRVPYTKIVMSLLALVLPLLVGVAVAKFRQAWAVKARRVGCLLETHCLVFLILRLSAPSPFRNFCLSFRCDIRHHL